jgi:hypothetical protein
MYVPERTYTKAAQQMPQLYVKQTHTIKFKFARRLIDATFFLFGNVHEQ